ncbi:molybdopterin converting factor subunit 1 [Roseococcus sp. SYP-B2431]|uniref:molybdopterin converting factor subunit 1 n=1 Tax=Roseococcus sp. SYP-B2431 TaxID=2496640 RepID=UPI00103CD7FF|nr:molybdopterin converting factor subunit 1 [Roseococcus sp. SYP-B2431]TCH98057.1 molybdopterin converting factor subunit 1 [Roseococcus sp. SYP-B2431]
MQILYFAWVREKVGTAGEELALPDGVRDVGALMRHLASLSPRHAEAFANPTAIRAAVNQEFATAEDAVADRDEVAFFPPVTGG